MTEPTGERFRLSLRELNGALGDLGTLLPLTLATIALAGLAPTPVLLGFAIFYIGTAFYYRLPIPVQPMKTVGAVLLTTAASPTVLATSGVMMGAILLVLGATGLITRLSRLVPQSVLAGLQLGLGIALAFVSFNLMASAPALGLITCAVLFALAFVPGCPSVLIALGAAIVGAQVLGVPGGGIAAVSSGLVAVPELPGLKEIEQALSLYVLPQLSLTLSNAVVLTALVAGDYFGDKAAHVTPARLSISTGLANLILTPFGALPMCHGSGGLAAHYRFGARSGTAQLVMGLMLLAVALIPNGVVLLAAIPSAGLGALLLVAAYELAMTRRLIDSKPSCWPVIAATAAVTVITDPFWGLVAGTLSELVRLAAVRLLRPKADT